MSVERQLAEARIVIYQMLPAVGMHARGFSQEALIRACFLVGDNPWSWTDHPDVLKRRLEIMPQRFRKKFEWRASSLSVPVPQEKNE